MRPVLSVNAARSARPPAREERLPAPAAAARPVDVLVLDGEQRQSLVSVRSLGRAGVRVAALERRPAPALRSRWCAAAVAVPDWFLDSDAFVDGVLTVVQRYAPRVVLPVSDGTLDALCRRRAEVEQDVRLAAASDEALAIAVDKERTLALAEELGIGIPGSVPVESVREVGAAVKEVGLPAVVKPVRSWVSQGRRGDRFTCELATTPQEAEVAVERILAAGSHALVQEWITGSREAVSLMYVNGRVVARFAQLTHRMFPPLGGSSIVRESLPLPRDVAEAAEALVAATNLEGYAEVEFRRDARGRPRLMEINPRLSASVELAVRAGVDFPLLLYRWANGDRMETLTEYRYGLRMRWLGGDLRWLRRAVIDRGRPDVPPTHRALGSFVADFFRPAAYDYVSLSDLRPALSATAGFFPRAFRRPRSPRVKVAPVDTEARCDTT
jgi:predicted ATP-grasp superfamily ATP-dependent carboligase